MSDKAIAIYVFIDDFLRCVGHKQDVHCKTNDAEILTTALLAAMYFHGNQATARQYVQLHHGLSKVDKSGYQRRLLGLEGQLLALFRAVGSTLKDLNVSGKYLIDSFPVAVCDNIRISRCRLLKGEAYRGKIASKRRYFYGFRVQVVTTAGGLPVDLYIQAGSFVDVRAIQVMNLDLPVGSEVYADAGYTDYQVEDLLAECEGIHLKVARRKNSKRGEAPWETFLKNHYRKRIETTFSQITGWFPKTIHAVTTKGFLLKIKLFIIAFTLFQVEW